MYPLVAPAAQYIPSTSNFIFFLYEISVIFSGLFFINFALLKPTIHFYNEHIWRNVSSTGIQTHNLLNLSLLR